MFGFTGLPPTMNHYWKFFRGRPVLSKDALPFQELVRYSMQRANAIPKEMVPMSIMMIFRSNRWVSKKGLLREMDVDNRIKPLLDAIQKASAMPDQLFFELHAYKQPWETEETLVYLSSF
jgi:Holliday junction resolvase RusA-like endonuclease